MHRSGLPHVTIGVAFGQKVHCDGQPLTGDQTQLVHARQAIANQECRLPQAQPGIAKTHLDYVEQSDVHSEMLDVQLVLERR